MNKSIAKTRHVLRTQVMRLKFVHWLAAAGVGLALLLVVTLQIVHAACNPGNLSDLCSASYGVVGNASTLNVPASDSAPTTAVVDQAQLLASGPLLYPDYKVLEAEARGLLQRSMKFRQDISPYRGLNNFNDLVRHFDEKSGFSANYTDPVLGQLTLQQRIDLADADLRQARNLYAFLTIYAPETRLRGDDGTNPAFPGADYKNTLCAKAENLSPPDPQHTGQVLEPVIDWCNFPARLRQAAREAAYLRMIFAQQFMVDALGLHFSAGTLLGGETFVRQEVAKLDAAKYQFGLAQNGLSEALGLRLGSGCYLADFYTQTEWALLSRAAEGQLTAQHHIATRLSYLDIKTGDDVPRAQNAAFEVYRAGSTQAYVSAADATPVTDIVVCDLPATDDAGNAMGTERDPWEEEEDSARNNAIFLPLVIR